MDVYHVTKVLIVAGLLALVASSPLPYGLKPFAQSTELNDSAALKNYLDKMKLLLALQWAGDVQPEDRQLSKRFDFGFSGLDNIDHILSTLDRKEATKPGGGTLKQQFISGPGSRSHDINKLKKLMQSVG